MRKLALAVIVMAFASCDKEVVKLDNGTGSLKVVTHVQTKKSGDVNRGTIPVYVKGINVHTQMGTLATDTEFNLVESGGDDDFIIDNVPLGPNDVTAITTVPDNVQTRHYFQSTTGNDYQGAVDYIRAHWSPYAVYTGSASVMVKEEDTPTTDVMMTTDNGRCYFAVTTEDENILENYDVYMRAKFYDLDGNVVYNHQVIYGDNDQGVTGYWSGPEVLGGARIEISFSWRAKGSNVEVNYKSTCLLINAGEDNYTLITLNNSTFYEEHVQFTFTFSPLDFIDDEVPIN